MIKVEVGQYRPIHKDGALKGTFSVVIYPHAQKIRNCKHFNMSGKDWFKFPDFLVKRKDGAKDEYFPYISFGDKAYLADLQDAIMKELLNQIIKISEDECPF